MDYNKKEKSEAKRMGATLHKNSGRGRVKKGDGSWKNFILDWKFARKSFTLNKDVWAKVVTAYTHFAGKDESRPEEEEEEGGGGGGGEGGRRNAI